jgi:hypothetical protein
MKKLNIFIREVILIMGFINKKTIEKERFFKILELKAFYLLFKSFLSVGRVY